MGRGSNELAHPLTVLEDAGPIVRERDAFRANRTQFRIGEPLLTFYHAIMRPAWPQLLRGTAGPQFWADSRERFASSILGPHFEAICREWAMYFAGDRFGGWPAEVAAGTVNDPENKQTMQVDVAVLGHADGDRTPLLAIGEAKWGELMRVRHLDRLRRARDLLRGNNKLDTGNTRLACFSARGFTDDLKDLARRGEADLVSLADLYG